MNYNDELKRMLKIMNEEEKKKTGDGSMSYGTVETVPYFSSLILLYTERKYLSIERRLLCRTIPKNRGCKKTV